MPERVPNELFASWFVRSGWSKGEVARLVNRRARDLGATHVATDTSRVRRWLDGEQPRDPIPRILTELFSERFACVVTLSDLGLREPSSPMAGALADLPWTGERIAELLAEFCRSDLILGRRGAGAAPPLAAGAALVEPVKHWLLAGGPAGPVPAQAERPAPPLGGRTQALVRYLETAAATFRDWFAEAGGGMRRSAAVGQLYEVAELVAGLPEPAPPQLFHAAAQLALLIGEMSFDLGLQATAQRYLILALHAAKESTDRDLTLCVVAAMGRQLIFLNRPQDTLDLLAVGRMANRGKDGRLASALADLVEARACGVLGRREQCLEAVERGKSKHAKAAASGLEPDWLAGQYHSAALQLDLGCALGDLAARVPPMARAAADHFAGSAAAYDRQWPAQLRGRVLAQLGLARAQLQLGDQQAAAAALRAAGAPMAQLRSRYAEEQFHELLGLAARRFPGAAEFTQLTPPRAAAPVF
ncbi:MAG TPA: hypothetical protein VGX23_10200 [Actinocrinis sp.]|nr:hypothetical protein [Actinocrinis sp.]